MEKTLSERETLAARYDTMKAAGLVDVKFYLRDPREATTEQVCREVNAMYEALDKGKSKPLDFGTAIAA